MNIVLLSGGSGKRLWPLSNDVRSKQFIKIFKNENGEYESMVQKVHRQIKKIDKNCSILIATSKKQVSAIKNQLSSDVNVCVEPSRKDTFPAIALAAAYLKYKERKDDEETVIVCPVDPLVNDDYFESFLELDKHIQMESANMMLMGMEPTYPSEKYGYIIPKDKDSISKVKSFKEKPNEDIAKLYIEQGALWNGGVFAFKLKYMITKAHELIDFADYDDLLKKYDKLTKISFDYAVVEKEENIKVKRFSGQWKDLGTWNTLTEAMNDNFLGKVIMNEKCSNTHVVNELDIPILCMGLNNMIIAASPEGVMISEKEQSSHIKPFVDTINQQIMFAEKSWGNFQVLDIGETSLTIKVSLNAGNQMNYHSHDRRDEIWTVVSGNGKAIVDGIEKYISIGDVIVMNSGCKHTVIANTDLQLIEVQIGNEININDKKKYVFIENK